MEPAETVIDSVSLYTGRVVHLRVDTVRLPDGRDAQREIVVHRGATCIVPVQSDGTVLLVRQFRLAAGRALLEIPAGTLEPGEDPLACAQRELQEETGYRAGRMQPLFQAYLAPGYSTELIHAFLATELTPVASRADPDEILQLVPISLDRIAESIRDGVLQDAKSIAALLMAQRVLQPSV
ncbi:MAG: NUDIX hydrolase [Chloroherpetonaceae bacterium]|nr:NUDIX hydrolase [Chthonomonadaceae bacterium]MDW8207686.1 NUDIX hydrolase [Chloroherpetonaceae bacterium]